MSENARPLNILVAEDEKNVARLVQVNLQRLGHTVTLVHDGEEAKKLALANDYDIILLDIMMPNMDGLEVLRNIRRDPRKREQKVILLTVKAQDDDLLRGVEAGANYYLTKPFNPDEVARVVQELCS